MAVRPREERTARGVALMALAVAFFTLIDSSAKWLMLAGLPTLQVVFCRYAGHFVLSLALFLPREGLAAFRSASPGWQAMRAVLLLGSTILNFTALFFLPITVTTTIMFAGPIVVTLLSIPILGEQVGIRRIAAVCTGFIGVLVVMQPWGAAFHPAMLLNLTSLLFSGLYFILTRKLAGIESNSTSQFWTSGFATVAMAPVAWSLWTWPATAWDFTVMLAIGCFGALGHICATSAHRLADASLLAPVIYIQLLLAALAGILFFDTWPTFWLLVGGLIIVGSGLYIWQRERQKGRPATLPDPRRAP